MAHRTMKEVRTENERLRDHINNLGHARNAANNNIDKLAVQSEKAGDIALSLGLRFITEKLNGDWRDSVRVVNSETTGTRKFSLPY